MKKRSHYLIKKKMQLKWAFRFLFFALILASFAAFEVYITIWPVVSGMIPKDLLGLITSQILFRMIFFSIPLLFVMVASVVVLTHRIAGPIYRLEKTIDMIIRGDDVGPINLRKNDEIKELAEKMNHLIGLIKKSKALSKDDEPIKP